MATITGTSGNDSLVGTSADDVIVGLGGDDTLVGGGGRDFFYGDAGNDSIVGGAGLFDWAFYEGTPAIGISLNLATGLVTGGFGNDTVVGIENVGGSILNDTIVGDGGNNSLQGRAGNDTLDGAGGSDIVDYFHAVGGVNVSLTTNTATGADGNDTLSNFENILGSSFNDTLTGNAGGNSLNGGNGADSIFGAGGSDFIIGGAGNDTLDGGVVTDLINYTDLNIVSYNGATAGVTINMSGVTGTGSTGSGTATGDASVGTDVLFNFNFIQGSAFNDTITGSAANWFEQIEGGAGNDVLDGGVMVAGNADNNRVTYFNTTGAGVVVDLIAGTAVGQVGSNAGSDSLTNFSFATGSNFADTLLGSNRTDRGETFEGARGRLEDRRLDLAGDDGAHRVLHG